jgi:hypothetical protein
MTPELAALRRQMLLGGLREPFIDQLDAWLTLWADALGTPDAPRELQTWMRKHPDRAAQAQAIFGRLAGYTERLEVRTDRTAALDALSDAELEQEVARRLGLPVAQLRGLAARPVLDAPARPPDAVALGQRTGECGSGQPEPGGEGPDAGRARGRESDARPRRDPPKKPGDGEPLGLVDGGGDANSGEQHA